MLRENSFGRESSSEQIVDHLVEAKDNVIEFPSKEPPAEHVAKHIFDQMSPEHKAEVILKDMGFASLDEADLASQKLEKKKQDLLRLVNTKDAGKEDKEKIVMTRGAKVKDYLLNSGRIVRELTSIEKEITLLSRKLRVIRIDLKDKDSEQEYKKAA